MTSLLLLWLLTQCHDLHKDCLRRSHVVSMEEMPVMGSVDMRRGGETDVIRSSRRKGRRGEEKEKGHRDHDESAVDITEVAAWAYFVMIFVILVFQYKYNVTFGWTSIWE